MAISFVRGLAFCSLPSLILAASATAAAQQMPGTCADITDAAERREFGCDPPVPPPDQEHTRQYTLILPPTVTVFAPSEIFQFVLKDLQLNKEERIGIRDARVQRPSDLHFTLTVRKSHQGVVRAKACTSTECGSPVETTGVARSASLPLPPLGVVTGWTKLHSWLPLLLSAAQAAVGIGLLADAVGKIGAFESNRWCEGPHCLPSKQGSYTGAQYEAIAGATLVSLAYPMCALLPRVLPPFKVPHARDDWPCVRYLVLRYKAPDDGTKLSGVSFDLGLKVHF